MEPPEQNVTGIDFADRVHFRCTGPPLVDVHAHVTRTGPPDQQAGEPALDQAVLLMAAAEEFGAGRVYSMCPPEDIPPLRQRFGNRLGFTASIMKKPDEPDEVAYRLLDRFLEQGVAMLKFWAAPRGRDRGLFVDASCLAEQSDVNAVDGVAGWAADGNGSHDPLPAKTVQTRNFATFVSSTSIPRPGASGTVIVPRSIRNGSARISSTRP